MFLTVLEWSSMLKELRIVVKISMAFSKAVVTCVINRYYEWTPHFTLIYLLNNSSTCHCWSKTYTATHLNPSIIHHSRRHFRLLDSTRQRDHNRNCLQFKFLASIFGREYPTTRSMPHLGRKFEAKVKAQQLNIVRHSRTMRMEDDLKTGSYETRGQESEKRFGFIDLFVLSLSACGGFRM